QGLLHRGLAAAVALDDGRLERQVAQLRHLQLDLTRPGVQLAGVVAGAGVEPLGGPLVTPGAAQVVGLGVEQGVDGGLDAVADHLVEVPVDLLLVDLDHGYRLRRRFRYTAHTVLRSGSAESFTNSTIQPGDPKIQCAKDTVPYRRPAPRRGAGTARR